MQGGLTKTKLADKHCKIEYRKAGGIWKPLRGFSAALKKQSRLMYR